MISSECELNPHGQDDQSHEARQRVPYESTFLFTGEARGQQHDQPGRHSRHGDSDKSRNRQFQARVSRREGIL